MISLYCTLYTANKLKCAKVKAHHSYLRPVSGMIKMSDESPMSDVYASTLVLSVDAFFSCLVIFLFTTMESPFLRSRQVDSPFEQEEQIWIVRNVGNKSMTTVSREYICHFNVITYQYDSCWALWDPHEEIKCNVRFDTKVMAWSALVDDCVLTIR